MSVNKTTLDRLAAGAVFCYGHNRDLSKLTDDNLFVKGYDTLRALRYSNFPVEHAHGDVGSIVALSLHALPAYDGLTERPENVKVTFVGHVRSFNLDDLKQTA